MTLDVKNGGPVRLEDIVWFDKQTEKPSHGDLFKIYKYRKTVFAPAVLQLLQDMYPVNIREDSNSINYADIWTMPVSHLSQKSLVLGYTKAGNNYLPEWAVIPYEKVKWFYGKHLSTE